MSEEKKVTLEMSVYQAAAVRQALFMDTKDYTYAVSYTHLTLPTIRLV